MNPTTTPTHAARRRGRHLALSVVAALLLAIPTVAYAAARAELRPGTQLAVGQPAQLVVTVDDATASPPAVRVNGADVRFSGQVAQTRSINGQTTTETSFIYSLVPRTTGSLAIPAITVGSEQTAPLEATVTAGPPPRQSTAPSAPAADRASTRAFIRLDLPKRTLYVGEAIPIKIRAYFRAGTMATLQGAPQVDQAAFTLGHLSETPVQKQVEIDGTPYLQATWTAVLSPAKPIDGKVAVELPVEMQFRDTRAVRRPAMRDLLDSDAFGGGFGADFDALFADPFSGTDPFAGMDALFETGPMRQQELTLRNAVGPLRIVEPPAANRPAGYGGAVGTFELAVDPPHADLRVGEPATLTYRVKGTGNFDRVAAAGIAGSADWKVYPGTTKVELEASGLGGTKTFTQTIVPVHAGELEIPALALAYFDPISKAYRTARTAAVHVVVAPPLAGDSADAGLAPSVAGATTTQAPLERGTTHATLTPLVRQPWFWGAAGLLVVAAALLVIVARARRSSWLHRRIGARSTHRAVARERARLDVASRRADPVAFFTAARSALQLELAAAWGIAPESITALDVEERLGERGASIRDVLDRADHITYARGAGGSADLARWRTIVLDQLATLEASR
ncbi:BatD family protein [soil metagenome]